MWAQIRAIARAQFLISRNHLPRTTIGTAVMFLFLSLWYVLFIALAILVAKKIGDATMAELGEWLPAGFLCVFFFWQIVPLVTLSGGWALELKKIQIYPVPRGALFGIETFLRITSAPEMLLVLAGAVVGLVLRGPTIAGLVGVGLFVMFNLFLQLGIRDLLLHSFKRSRSREVLAVLFISLGVLPQFFFRSALVQRISPYIWRQAQTKFYPWSEVALLNTGRLQLVSLAGLFLWTTISFLFAYWAFSRGLSSDDAFQGALHPEKKSRRFLQWAAVAALPWPDPMSSLIEKEIRSLFRMPRFRVIFGMSCVLGLLIFVPHSLGERGAASHFIQEHSFSLMNLYGLLLLSEMVIFNVFGADQAAVQLYFAAPLDLTKVLKAKNIAAAFCVLLQNLVIITISMLLRSKTRWANVASGLLICAVALILLLSIGNLTSVATPRALDPNETFKKQSGGKIQIWLFGGALALFLLLGFAFLAEYAFESRWALFAVLFVEFAAGLTIYQYALKAAVRRALADREAIIRALGASKSPVGVG